MKSTTKERLEVCQKARRLPHPGITNWFRAEIHHLIHEGTVQEQQNAKRKYFYRFYKSDLENGFPVLLTKEEVSRFEKEQEDLKSTLNEPQPLLQCDESEVEDYEYSDSARNFAIGFTILTVVGILILLALATTV